MRLLFILLLSCSCTSGLIIRPGDCPSYVVVKNGNERAQKNSEFSVTEFGVGDQELSITELLKEANAPSCKKLSALRISISSDSVDQIISAIPFVAKWTIALDWDEAPSKAESK